MNYQIPPEGQFEITIPHDITNILTFKQKNWRSNLNIHILKLVSTTVRLVTAEETLQSDLAFGDKE